MNESRPGRGFNIFWPRKGTAGDTVQWKRLGRRYFGQAEETLRRRESYCVSACARFLNLARFGDRIWGLWDSPGPLSALLIYGKQTIFPVFNGLEEVSLPRPIQRFLKGVPFHAVQGLQEDVLLLEEALRGQGRKSIDPIDYSLMALNRRPPAETLRSGPSGLIVRAPDPRELETVLPLQTAYEREEVLPQGANFNPAVCRMNLEHIFEAQRILVAEWGGRIVAKANTSAFSFTRAQIGGVFVEPRCRGLGIGRRLCAALAETLTAEGWGLSLFVKKRNHSALAAYRAVGFKPIADYRISYY
ncbi:MAG: GNAT family N-acetyltransferase [Treponema sp.]|jgi:ribosomal protein S18 acetylase RimI-like enzyme|nr:GNAT family N-acetyltransferase [Treponema sp.]